MFRWLTHSRSPIRIDELIVKPRHSLIDQSTSSTMGATTTNGDGFGPEWYGVGAEPGVFHSTEPAWNDRNLKELARHLVSPMVFACAMTRRPPWRERWGSSRRPDVPTESRTRSR